MGDKKELKAGTTEYKNAWMKEHKERINLSVDKGFKQKVKAAADSQNKSLNGFIIDAIETAIHNCTVHDKKITCTQEEKPQFKSAADLQEFINKRKEEIKANKEETEKQEDNIFLEHLKELKKNKTE